MAPAGGGTVGGPSDWNILNKPTSPASGGLYSLGGCIAATTANSIVYAMANAVAGDSGNGNPYGGYVFYTTNGGSTWNESNVSRDVGFYLRNAFNSLRRQILIADRVNGYYYMYNSGTTPGFYRSTNGGAAFTMACAGSIGTNDGFNAQMRAVPPYTGYTGGAFYATHGMNDDDSIMTASFWECKDVSGTLTKTAVSGVKNVWSFGFGKSLTTGGYPTIFIRGNVDNAHAIGGVGGYGIWMTNDHCATWKQLVEPGGLVGINVFVNNIMDQQNVIEGDMNIYGKCYVGYAGDGVAVYNP